MLVTEAETTVFLVDFEHLNFDRSTNLSELAGVLHLLSPREVRDVDETINTFFELYEHTEVSEVAHLSSVLRTNGVLHFDILPRIFLELLDAERHLAFSAVECEDHSFDFVTYLEEVLCRTEVLAPRHFRNVDETFNARCDFYECTVVSHHYYAALNLVAHLEVRIECIPGVRSELLDTKSDALLFFVEVEDNHVELLVVLNHFARIAHATPREVSDVYETVNATEVDEYTVVGDVLNGTFEHLTLFELADDFLLLSFEFSFDERLVANHYVLVFLVDLDNLEFHSLTNEYIVVADGLHVDL